MLSIFAKKGLVLACCLLGGLFLAETFAQKISAKKVPAAVRDNFQKKYPAAERVRWRTEEDGEFEVKFKSSGKQMEAAFKADGAWLETEMEISMKQLPAAVVAGLDKEFPGFEREEAEKLDTPTGVAYELEVEKGDEEWEVVFSADGKLLKKVKEEEDEKN